MRGYKINIKSAYLLFSVEHKFTFPFDFFPVQIAESFAVIISSLQLMKHRLLMES